MLSSVNERRDEIVDKYCSFANEVHVVNRVEFLIQG